LRLGVKALCPPPVPDASRKGAKNAKLWFLLCPIVLIATGLSALPEPASSTYGPYENTFFWISLSWTNDTRDSEMQAFDDRIDQDFVHQINATKALPKPIRWIKMPVSALTNAPSPFACIHHDPVKPSDFTPVEKEVLEEYLVKGGFINFIKDEYHPEYYSIETTNAALVGPVSIGKFFRVELPERNPEFSLQKASEILTEYYRHPPSPEQEMKPDKRKYPSLFDSGKENASKVLVYHGRLVACSYSLTGYMNPEGNPGPLSRPFKLPGWTVDYALNMYLNALLK